MSEPPGPKTLYIIDGHAQFFRAFHAIRTAMTSPVTKEPTNATFGFVGMILKLLRTCHPDYLAVVIDVSGDQESFRSELYPAYKANREPPPETLHPQVERCVSLLQEIGVPVLGVERVEADDVIATIVESLIRDRDDLRISIVSKDKDLQQLLIPGRVQMYDVHTEEAITVEKLKETKGVAPEQVVDMLTLMGDTVDNVPGVEGIGPKTAAQLIAQYGSLDELLAHADEIKGKRGERLREAAPRLPLSKQLITLKRDVEVDFDLENANTERFDLSRLIPILKELGFNRHQNEVQELLGSESSDDEPAPALSPVRSRSAPPEYGGTLFDVTPEIEPAGEYACVRTEDELRALIEELKAADIFAIDTETTGLSPLTSDLVGLSFSTRPGVAAYVPVRSPEPETHLSCAQAMEMLRTILVDPAHKKCGHNLKYDQLILRNHGIELRGVAFDSMVASFLIDASRSSHSLDALALALLKHECVSIKELIGVGKNQRTFAEVPLRQAVAYAAEDADIALRLCQAMAPQIRAMQLQELFDDVEMPLVHVLAELEWNGVKVDADELDRQALGLRARIEELREEIEKQAPRPFNPDSPKQLSAVLFNKSDDDEAPGLGIKPIKRTKTGYSTDVEVLEKLAADPEVETPIPGLVLEHRQLTKLVSTYLVALKEAINPKTGRVHASFHQTGAATGRLSSSDPNLQNIPIRSEIGRKIRRAFVPEDGNQFIVADYSQVELRLLAHLSRDENLLAAFERGADIHREVAAQINNVAIDDVTSEQRSAAKMVNFGIVYGVTPFGLARRLEISDAEAGQIIDDYKHRFPGITTFLQECVAQAIRYGYVETILKRRRSVPQVESRRPQERAMGERVAINSVVQGSAADLIKLAMVDLQRLVDAGRSGEGGAEVSDEARALAGTKMLIQIHDELVFETPADLAPGAMGVIVARMEGAMKLRTPLKIDASMASRWSEGK